MKTYRISLVILITLVVTLPAFAQSDRKPLPKDEQSKYVISARAGLINTVEGEVTVKSSKQDVTPADQVAGRELNEGDTVTTGEDGRVEILLNPGCYLRLAENTVFAMANDSLGKLTVKLLKGSAIVEASAFDKEIAVVTPQREVSIIREGLYRFNIQADSSAEVIVRKGRVMVAGVVIKDNKKAIVGAGTPAIAKADGKKSQDGFDTWSKDRAKTLIAANKKLSQRVMRRSSALQLAFNTWVYNPYLGCYTFLPYGYGFSSPYGGYYSVWNPFGYYCCSGYNRGWGGGGTAGGDNRGGGGGTGGIGRPGSGGGTGGGGTGGGGRVVVADPPASRGRDESFGGDRPAPRPGGRRP